MREDKQEGQQGCTRFQSGVARLGLGSEIARRNEEEIDARKCYELDKYNCLFRDLERVLAFSFRLLASAVSVNWDIINYFGGDRNGF